MRFEIIAAATIPFLAAPAWAGGYYNAAQGRGVSIVSGSANGAALSTLTDGTFLPAGTQWQTGTVWWSGTGSMLEIGLGDVVTVSGAIVQADNNDTYRMWYRDMGTGLFQELWTIGAVGGAGMRTRPNASNDGEIFFFPASVTTDAIRIAAIGGDGAYSLSEVQVWATVPGPGAIPLLGLAPLVRSRRRRA
jgi:hypothetical protein